VPENILLDRLMCKVLLFYT